MIDVIGTGAQSPPRRGERSPLNWSTCVAASCSGSVPIFKDKEVRKHESSRHPTLENKGKRLPIDKRPANPLLEGFGSGICKAQFKGYAAVREVHAKYSRILLYRKEYLMMIKNLYIHFSGAYLSTARLGSAAEGTRGRSLSDPLSPELMAEFGLQTRIRTFGRLLFNRQHCADPLPSKIAQWEIQRGHMLGH
jgi:hypothetical protein